MFTRVFEAGEKVEKERRVRKNTKTDWLPSSSPASNLFPFRNLRPSANGSDVAVSPTFSPTSKHPLLPPHLRRLLITGFGFAERDAAPPLSGVLILMPVSALACGSFRVC